MYIKNHAHRCFCNQDSTYFSILSFSANALYDFQMAKNKRASEKGEVPCIYLRLEAFTPIQSEVYQTRWQENQHLLSFSNLAFSPTRRTLGSYFCRHHNVHDDIITVLAKVVHNRGHFVSKSVTFWIITGVV